MKIINLLGGFSVAAVLATNANAAMVAYFPVTSSTDSATFLNDVIDDPTHGITDATTTGSGSTASGIANSSILFDATRGGDVLSTVEGHRMRAGTQDINLNTGFAWSFWININSSNITDTGADSIMGTRSGSATGGGGSPWHKMDLTSTGSWHGSVPSSGTYTGGTLADNTWHFITYTGDTTNRQIYKDGVLIAQDTVLTGTHNLTFNGIMEIGGASTFTEDVTGLYDEIAIWNERLSVDELFSLYELTSRSLDEGLLYTTAEFDLLKSIHDAASGSIMIGGLEWMYATNLIEAAGLTLNGSTYTLVLNDAANTGLIGAMPIPEPGVFALFGCTLILMNAHRRSRPR